MHLYHIIIKIKTLDGTDLEYKSLPSTQIYSEKDAISMFEDLLPEDCSEEIKLNYSIVEDWTKVLLTKDLKLEDIMIEEKGGKFTLWKTFTITLFFLLFIILLIIL